MLVYSGLLWLQNGSVVAPDLCRGYHPAVKLFSNPGLSNMSATKEEV